MFCPECGTQNPDESKFCLSCGTALDEAAGGAEESVTPGEEPASETLVSEGAPTQAAVPEPTVASPAPTPTPAPAPTVTAGASDQLGPYQLLGELGRGAMARVWRAYDANLEREVAIKEPLFDQNLSAEVLDEMGRRFVKEGRAAARLTHPNIVSIYAADVYDGRPAIVMELVEGVTLGTLLESGPLAPPEALSVLDQLLDAVGYAHSKGVVHRDIKPENIFVSSEGVVKLADFGIARVDNSQKTQATMVGTVLGTPGYMSPEQATGNPVDERSDLFSVATVGYEMLTGTNPFNPDGADSTTLLFRIVHQNVPELPDSSTAGLPADMRPAIGAALSKDPAWRPQSAADFKSMLHGGMNIPTTPAPTQANTANLADKVAKSSSGMPKWLPYVAAAVVGVVILLGVFMGATGGGGGGATGGAVAPGGYYVTTYQDKVAIFSASNPAPVETTDINVADLDSTTAANLGSKIQVNTLEDAQTLVKGYKDDIEEKKKAEEEAKAAEEEAKKKAEEEAAAAAAAAASSTTLSCVGKDGTTRTETIHWVRDEMIVPDAFDRILSDDEIAAMNQGERCVARNEIIARNNGYSFKNGGLRDYFRARPWYNEVPGADGGGDLARDSIAWQNVEKLRNWTDGWWLNLATY